MSLDALRGFIMFWIVGGEGLVFAMHKLSPEGFWGAVAHQMDHVAWEGLAFYDLIFPSFVFIVGVSLVFSLARVSGETGRTAALRKIFTRALTLYFIGVFLYGGIAKGWEGVRWLGVLQRIAICYGVSATLLLYLRWRGLVAVCASLLLGYWALMSFVPIREFNLEKQQLQTSLATAGEIDAVALYRTTEARVSGRFEEGLNLANHVDFEYLPGRRWDGAYDPEGLLSTLPAIATCLLGVFAGMLLKTEQFTPRRKTTILVGAGIVGLLVGTLWGLQFPVIKKLWTSSYVLVAGGWSCLFLAAFYWVIDLRGHQRWSLPLIWIGMNPITIYVVDHLIKVPTLAERLVGGPLQMALGPVGPLLIALVSMLMVFAFARFLYQRRIFLKV